MNVLSLFSGIGGIDLGLERAGMTVVGQVEIDPWCRQILAKHWPEVPRHDDVRTCTEWWLGQPRPVVDLICGGVPCQPVSLAGLGLAQDDPRWLWPATIEAVGVLRPRFALLENVPGLLARGMGDVLGQLAEVGYDAEWDCVPAQAVGAPHRRDRVWIVAYPADDGAGRRQQQPEGSEGTRHVADTARLRPGQPRLGTVDGGASGRGSERLGAVTAETVADADSEGLDRLAQRDRPASERERTAPLGRDAERRPDPQRRHADAAGMATVAHAHREPLGWAAITRRECDHWVTEPDVGRVAHGIPRRVDRLRGLGNAVVPQVAEHIGRLIMEAAA